MGRGSIGARRGRKKKEKGTKKELRVLCEPSVRLSGTGKLCLEALPHLDSISEAQGDWNSILKDAELSENPPLRLLGSSKLCSVASPSPEHHV